MSGLQVVREQRLGFDERGNSANVDEVYVKILACFQDVLPLFKGARLATFMCVALQEAKIVLGLGSALSLSSIQGIIDYSRHTVIAALDFLVERRFLEELPERGPNGEKFYRVASYAWYGKPRFSPSGASPSGPPWGAVFAPVQKNPLAVEDDLPNETEKSDPTPTSGMAARKILHQVGVYASHLSEIDAERAARWAEFVKLAPRHTFRSPAGFCFAALAKDPQAEPPMLEGLSENSRARGWWNGEHDQHINR